MFGESVLVTDDNKFKVAEWISEYEGYYATASIASVGESFIHIINDDIKPHIAKVGMYVSVTDFEGMPIITVQTAAQWQRDFGVIDN